MQRQPKRTKYQTSVGGIGEEFACSYLEEQGYKVLRRNYRIRGGEIDIIAKDKDTIAFVEVKTRLNHQFGLPEEAITPTKISFLTRAIEYFATVHNLHDKLLRLDAVVMDLSHDKAIQRISLIKNIIQ